MPLSHGQSSKDLLRDGLFAEESEGDLKIATEKYETLLKAFEAERKVAAVALFRLAAVKRKQGEDKAALALYEEFVKKFGNIEPQATLVRENYQAISGKEFPSQLGAGLEEDKELARIKKLEVTSPDLFPNFDELEGYVFSGKSKLVAYLLKRGADPNHQGILVKAVLKGNLAMVRQLLEAGADPNHQNNRDAFSVAVRQGHWQIAKLLGENKANIKNSWPSILSDNKIMDLSPDKIAFLVSYGADPNYITEKWSSKDSQSPIGIALHDAVRLKKYDYVKLLLKIGAEVDRSRPTDGVRALHLACQQGDEKMIKILLKAGSDPNASTGNKTEKKASFPARYVKAKLRIPIDVMPIEQVSILVQAGARFSPDLLLRAVLTGKTEIVEYLISKGADVNQHTGFSNVQGKNPLSGAFANRDDKMIRLLLSKGAKLSEVSWSVLPPLYRIEAAREFHYNQLAEEGRIHVVFPEVGRLNTSTFSVDKGSDVIANFLETSLPTVVRFQAAENQMSEYRQINYDGLAWNLIRGGKVKKIDLNGKILSEFVEGDVIELTGFSGLSDDLSFDRNKMLKMIRCHFSTHLRKSSRFPIKISYAGVTHDMMICPDKLTFDARGNQIPTGDLGKVLSLIFTDSFRNGYEDSLEPKSELEIVVKRSGFPEFGFRSNKDALFGFELKSGDHISVLCVDDNTDSDESEAVKVKRWEDYESRHSVSAQIPGKLGKWRWRVKPSVDGVSMGPSLLALIADINRGEKFSEDSVDQVAFRRKLTGGTFLKILPGIDLSRIVIYREKKEIVINLSEKIAKWDESGRKAPLFDYQLQAGDRIDLSVLEGEWGGFPEVANQYFEAVLNVPLIMSKSGSTDSFELNFRMPNWYYRDWGYLAMAKEETKSSVRGAGLGPVGITLQRMGKEFRSLSHELYWPRSGDIIRIPFNNNNKNAQSRVRRVPVAPNRSRQNGTKEWPPSEGAEKKK